VLSVPRAGAGLPVGGVYLLGYTWVKAKQTMGISRNKRSERFVWMGVSVFLLTAVVLVAFSPRALAQSRDDEKRALMKSFQDVFDFVQKNYVDDSKVDSKVLVDGALKGLFDSLGDPYSTYLTGEDLRALEDTTQGEFSGIGVVITKPTDAEGAEVVTPIEGTPAYRAGLSAADLIVKINGEDARELTLNDIVGKIRGPKGSELTLTIKRGKALVFDVTVQRDNVEVPTGKRAMIPGGIGYLRLTTFTPYTSGYAKDAIGYFQQNGYRALIVDVRSNGGGRLDSVIEIADYFLDTGTIVSTRGRVGGESAAYPAHAADTIVPASLPVVVLINGGSASASEILAGALKDTGRAIVIGEKSYGKGTVQQVRKIGSFEFKLTMSKYYTPSGVSIDGKGIEPDIVVKEDQIADAELDSYNRLVKEGRIRAFVEQQSGDSGPGEAAITAFVATLKKDGFDLRERIVRKLVRDEANRSNNTPPVYDLEFDQGLQKAVDVLSKATPQAPAR
jgi:carboxyl-terminal processing protease